MLKEKEAQEVIECMIGRESHPSKRAFRRRINMEAKSNVKGMAGGSM